MSGDVNILVTGSRAPVAVLMARTLKAAGFVAYTADSLRPNLAQYSRAPVADFALPPPRTQQAAFREAVAALVADKSISVVVPTCEEVYHLACIETPSLFAPPLSILDALHNKFTVTHVAARAGLEMPETRFLGSAADRETRIPYDRDGVLKRVYSRFSQQVALLRGSPKARRRAAARLDFTDDAAWIWQAWAEGRSVCTYSLCRDGRIAYHAAYTTPYAMGRGAGVYYKSVEPSASLEAAARIAEATHFTGQLSLDFIEDDAGGLQLIECNPRATMGLALCCQRSDFPAVLRDVLIGDGAFQTGAVPPGIAVQMRLATALFGVAHRAHGIGIRQWFRDVRRTPDALADPDDPGPLRAQPGILFRYALRAVRARLSLTAYATHDIEWNGRDEKGDSWLPK